jgi:hypothetical protein
VTIDAMDCQCGDLSCARPHAPENRKSDPTANGSAAQMSIGRGGCSRRRSLTTSFIVSSPMDNWKDQLAENPTVNFFLGDALTTFNAAPFLYQDSVKIVDGLALNN